MMTLLEIASQEGLSPQIRAHYRVDDVSRTESSKQNAPRQREPSGGVLV
jgi:hypothetical protein